MDDSGAAYAVGRLIGTGLALLLVALIIAGIVKLIMHLTSGKASDQPQAVAVPVRGWHPDPTGRFAQRWWTGAEWTADVVDAHGQVGSDDADGA